jgi:hypothetical protein
MITAKSLLILGWLAGSWAQRSAEATMEVQIGSPAGNMVLSHWKSTDANGKVDFFEFEKIAINEEGNVLLAPYPFGTEGVSFPATEISESKAVFENPAHDFPRRISYEKLPEDRLGVRVEGEGDGQPLVIEFELKREVAAPGAKQ